ncbi:DUF2490 domain-containing protein [Maribacter sp. MMG018]|uniref:DUF2490 domain-containing protein n=1 Tax=Maribacter sp. MMG018 TaxID=2822688 RepID=UPI001B38AC34|nr:DUF2490 domain-containing protein [Maribacter sp. MMG018]MBQ4915343.1 DUF2490 domain-containing protein [Maribacter sp. MMG018]
MRKILFVFSLVSMYCSNGLAQFTPPGLGKTNTVSWFAIGVKQKLNEKGSVSSATHFGLGRISDPDNYNLFQKQSIYVINEEVTNHFKEHWAYSVALSYRWQNKYKTTAPYESDNPDARQEIRAYGRFSYLGTFNTINYSIDFRPEYRRFYDPDFTQATENTQFRSRFRAKMTFDLNSLKTDKFITTAEFLFSTTKTSSWSAFEYKETRLCLYYSHTVPKLKTTFNIGYMNNILGKSAITDVHYLAFDVAIKNPFGT